MFKASGDGPFETAFFGKVFHPIQRPNAVIEVVVEDFVQFLGFVGELGVTSFLLLKKTLRLFIPASKFVISIYNLMDRIDRRFVFFQIF